MDGRSGKVMIWLDNNGELLETMQRLVLSVNSSHRVESLNPNDGINTCLPHVGSREEHLTIEATNEVISSAGFSYQELTSKFRVLLRQLEVR